MIRALSAPTSEGLNGGLYVWWRRSRLGRSMPASRHEGSQSLGRSRPQVVERYRSNEIRRDHHQGSPCIHSVMTRIAPRLSFHEANGQDICH